jgi:VWFA-related protein
MAGSFARVVFLLAVAGVRAIAQGTPPAPPAAASPAPAAAPAQTAPAKTASATAVTTLKANAQLVVVDVVVTDGSKKPVHGLKAADFTLHEGNTPQVIKSFEEHSALTLADATKFAPMPKLEPGLFTNYTPEPANGAVNLLLLDALNTPLASQAYVRQQLLDYLKSRPPGTRIAIFGLTTRLLVLQGFTSDPDTLKNALTKGRGKASPLLDDQVGGGGIQNSLADDLEDAGGDAGVVANLQQFEAQQQSYQLQLRAKYTLDAMNQIARYLAVIPGRKNLIWFSGSFPVSVLPDATLANPFAVMASAEDEFRDTVNLLARSQVAVYPVDARGLTNSPGFDASTNRYGGPNGTKRLAQDQTKFFSDNASEHATMMEMADATGGRAFVNTNGLTAAMASAIDEGSNFYTLTYTPTDSSRNGEFRKIKVQLARQGLNLSYRKGYYADDPDKAKSYAKPADAAVTTATAPNSLENVRIALTRGAPTPTEILIQVGVVPMNPVTQPEDKPAQGNTPAPKTHGPFRRYSVNYLINPGDLTYLRGADGKAHADFEFIILVFNPDGTVVNSTSNTLHFSATMDQLKKVLSEGILGHDEISAPIKGEYFLRIAVHDLHRDHYGAVEVATSSVTNVVPKPASPAAPAAAAPPPAPAASAPR